MRGLKETHRSSQATPFKVSQPLKVAAAQKAKVIPGCINGELESRSREVLVLICFTTEETYCGCVSSIRVVVQDAREAEV